VIELVARNVFPSVKVVLVSLASSCPSILWGMLIAGNPRPRIHANVVVVALDDDLIDLAIAVSLVMSMPVVIVVVMMVSMASMSWVR